MEGERRKAKGGGRKSRTRAGLSLLLISALCLSPFVFAERGRAQAGRRPPGAGEKKNTPPQRPDEPKPAESPTPQPPQREEENAQEEVDEGDAVRVETNLVTVPVVASDRGGRYVPDLKAEEFSVTEDGAEQKVAFFATVSAPFSVVLMIDTSASATVEKLRQVQDAAVAFTEQLREGDRVKVISFDDEVRDLSDFTNDRAKLASAIRATRPGKGTRLYDAFDLAARSLRRVKAGRKAVIMLTDGMDFHSAERTYDDNRRAVEESDVVVYPVRFDTRAETEQLARSQARGGSGPIDVGTVLGGRVPGLPGGTVVLNPRGGSRRDDRDDGRTESGLPDATSRRPGDGPGARGGVGVPRDTREAEDASIRAMLDNLYKLADDYLQEMARSTGGQLVRADNPSMLPRAFKQIADELGTQYSLGYYPANNARDGKLRKIRVRTTRKDVTLRTRPGYRARKQLPD